MATPRDVVVEQLRMGGRLLDMLTADLCEADWFTPAAPHTNHTAWVLGHLAVSEDSMVSKISGKPMRLTPAMHELFNGKSKCHAEAARYPAVKEIQEMFREQRAHTLEAAMTFDNARWGEPAPEGVPRDFFPTLGSFWGLIGAHQFWHIGQVTTCRKVLGKKAVLGG